MNVKIRSAGLDDAPFIAWVMLAAARSHNKYGLWDHYVGGTEEECLSFLRLLAATQKPHLFHYSAFIVAEVNGQKAGALSGYDPKTLGMRTFVKALPEVVQKLGWSQDYQKTAMERNLPYMACFSDDADGAWIVESVAVLPEYRKQGIVNLLLQEIIDQGRKNGFKLAQISVIVDNKPARKAYEKQGFKFDREKRDSSFEVIYGSPGIERLLLPL
jgi:ribosomal protein S18 acetylase RimI-like enzyme